jgi:hypothetical protein
LDIVRGRVDVRYANPIWEARASVRRIVREASVTGTLNGRPIAARATTPRRFS